MSRVGATAGATDGWRGGLALLDAVDTAAADLAPRCGGSAPRRAQASESAHAARTPTWLTGKLVTLEPFRTSLNRLASASPREGC